MTQLNKSLLSSVLLCLLFSSFGSLQVRATLAEVPDIGDADLEETVLHSEVPVLVTFWAMWCGPCRTILPIIEDVARQYDGRLKVYKLNIDENQATVNKYHIWSIPRLLIFKDGEVQGALVGAILSKASIFNLIDRVLNENGISIDSSM